MTIMSTSIVNDKIWPRGTRGGIGLERVDHRDSAGYSCSLTIRHFGEEPHELISPLLSRGGTSRELAPRKLGAQASQAPTEEGNPP